MAPLLSIEGVSKDFQARGRRILALDSVTLAVEKGEFVTVVGPSGCGKSTLLNLIVGLLRPSAGCIRFRDRPINGINSEIGYVTQKDNLLPWRSLAANVEVALEIRGVEPKERKRRAADLIHQVGLGGFEDHYPHELSGGMRQRANIIRTLIYDPQLILMDEPFGPLDAQTRIVLQDQLLRLWTAARKTIVFITHDLVEAIALADRVVMLTSRPGKVKCVAGVPIARPRNVYQIHRHHEFSSIYERLWKELRPEVDLADTWKGGAPA
ncbi:MAG TPA: ABC transporter ATP-binding protein [bacterium]|nr:ABC transporter ATP-binding protein [bacterium]